MALGMKGHAEDRIAVAREHQRLAAVHRPDSYRAVSPAGAGEAAPVRTENHALDRGRSMAPKGAQQPARLGFIHANQAVRRGHGYAAAIRAKGHAEITEQW